MSKLPSLVKAALPKGWTAERFKAAVADKHPDLVPVFEHDVALDLMFTESRVLLTAMLDLMRQGVPMLGMHDEGMVPASRWREAKAAMKGLRRR